MALVPGGVALLGSRTAPERAPPREVALPAFHMSRTEVTVAQFVRFLEMTGADFASPQIRRVGDAYVMRQPAEPVAYVSYDEARAYAAWLSERLGRVFDLPTEDEWEFAARAGVRGAPYPWGWGDPSSRACFRAEGPMPVGCFAANPAGLRDLAGNVAEWCRPSDAEAARAPVRGGSWADRTEDLLRVYRRVALDRAYRDADVGFRVVAYDVAAGASP